MVQHDNTKALGGCFAGESVKFTARIGAVSSFFGLGKDAPAIGDALPDTEQTEREDALESDKAGGWCIPAHRKL